MNPVLETFVDSLSRKQQDRVLGAKLAPGFFKGADAQCLVGAAFDCTGHELSFMFRDKWYEVRHGLDLWGVAMAFDSACYSNSGSPSAIGAEIRQHILERRARKLLGPRRHPEPSPRNPTETPELVYALAR